MWNDFLEQLKGFLNTRIAFWDDVQKAKTPHQRWISLLKLIQPILPSIYHHYGQIEFFPPRLSKHECMIVICNHQSDLDGFIAMSLLHTQFIERQVKPLDSSKLDSHYSDSVTASIRPVGFTLSHFSQIPGLGPVLTESAILINKGITDEELERRIVQRIDEGFNTFLLFPEGAIHSFEQDLKSKEFWKNSHDPSSSPYPFRNVFMPRFKCWEKLNSLLKHRLRYVVDLTLLYPQYKPWSSSWNYDKYPSAAYSLTKPMTDPVFTHTEIYDLHKMAEQHQVDKADLVRQFSSNDTLLDMWIRKEKRLNQLRQREMEYRNRG